MHNKKEMKYYVYNGNMEDTFLGFNACGNFRRCLRDNSRHFSSGSILRTKQWESVPSWYFFRKKTHSDWPTLYKPLIYFIFSWFLDYFRDEYVGKWWWLIDRQLKCDSNWKENKQQEFQDVWKESAEGLINESCQLNFEGLSNPSHAEIWASPKEIVKRSVQE